MNQTVVDSEKLENANKPKPISVQCYPAYRQNKLFINLNDIITVLSRTDFVFILEEGGGASSCTVHKNNNRSLVLCNKYFSHVP